MWFALTWGCVSFVANEQNRVHGAREGMVMGWKRLVHVLCLSPFCVLGGKRNRAQCEVEGHKQRCTCYFFCEKADISGRGQGMQQGVEGSYLEHARARGRNWDFKCPKCTDGHLYAEIEATHLGHRQQTYLDRHSSSKFHLGANH